MDYKEIKQDILNITNELNSVVSIKDHDYTHQPSEELILDKLSNCINELVRLHDKIKEGDDLPDLDNHDPNFPFSPWG